MASNPWYTSQDIIDAVKRKISFPAAQATFTDDEILDFANEEMMIAQVPSIMQFHEEYLVTSQTIPLQSNLSRYPIPERAIGTKLRDIFWSDQNGNLFDMTRISADDKAFFQRNVGANQAIHKFYVEGNDIVLAPQVGPEPTGSLVMYYFLRPSQLVLNERAAIISKFENRVTIDNASISPGDTISIAGVTFTAVAGSPSTNEFQIGGTSIATATNLAVAINTNGIVTASNGSPSTAIVTVEHTSLDYEFTTSNTTAFSIDDRKILQFTTTIPSNITAGSTVDFLQTRPGHRIRQMDVTIANNAISSNVIFFDADDVPSDLIVGDYICLSSECIIPQIPTDLHNVLAERTAARILAAIGDTEGLNVVNSKLQEMEMRQGTLIDARVEGAPQKVLNRNSILRYFKMGVTRRR